MDNTDKRQALSLLIAAGGCVAGAYSAYAAFSNGALLAGGAPGIMFGLAFAAVVVISWIMLPFADKRGEEGAHRDAWLWRVSWLVAVGFVLANSVVYCVHYRLEMTESKGLQIDAYERAKQAETQAAAELDKLKTNPRWDATSGCSDVTAPKSKVFCEQVNAAKARIDAAAPVLSQGRPASKDAGAESLAWMLGTDESTVRRSLPIFWALILELIASLCMREAFATLRSPAALGRSPEPALERPRPRAEDRVAGAPVPALAHFAAFDRSALPKGAAMNDNMPVAIYA
ncbi:MAG: hypothetical protein WAN43_07900 [Rhodomicrobium sp.]